MRLALAVTPHVEANLKLAAQIGVTDVIARYPGSLGRELEEMVQQAKGHGLRLSVVEGYIPHDLITHGKPGRDEQIDQFIDLLKNMARLGVTVCSYNFMPNDDWSRTQTAALERGGALTTAFDVKEVSDAPGAGGPITSEALWSNLAYFLNAVVPVAEREGVLLALHPDDPPVSPMQQQERIIISPDAYDRVFKINDSPANGMCFCQGTFASMADHDIPSLIRRFDRRIHYVHFRDVVGKVPAFRETFHDNGKTDMNACMLAYRDIQFKGPARPDHVPTLHGESNDTPGYHMMGRLFAIGYMRGLMHAAGMK